MERDNIKNYNVKYLFLKSIAELNYKILNDYNEREKRYWYICKSDGSPLYDDDGNNLHFDSYEKATEYLKQLSD